MKKLILILLLGVFAFGSTLTAQALPKIKRSDQTEFSKFYPAKDAVVFITVGKFETTFNDTGQKRQETVKDNILNHTTTETNKVTFLHIDPGLK